MFGDTHSFRLPWAHPASKHRTVAPTLTQPFGKQSVRHFPGGPVVKHLPCNAGHTGSIPGLGSFRMQLNPWTTATEPALWVLFSSTREATAIEAHAPLRRVAPLTTTRESPRTATETSPTKKPNWLI